MHRRNQDIDRRGRLLAEGKRGNGPVVYLMSRDQRSEDNWALLWAQQEALIRQRPLAVLVCLDPENLGTDPRHARFMVQGLAVLQDQLVSRNIEFHVLDGSSAELVPHFMKRRDGHLLVTDFSPLHRSRERIDFILRRISAPCHEVDAHNIIPAWLVSEKKEYAAYTIRPKIHRLLPDFLTDFPRLVDHPGTKPTSVTHDLNHLASRFPPIQHSIDDRFTPGEDAAVSAMEAAMSERLTRYSTDRNNPCLNGQSNLSPYLHFGHLAPQRLALNVQASGLPEEAKTDFLEELVVRRELADNFCFHEAGYDRFSGFPDWAQKSLEAHRADVRDFCYTLEEFEGGQTHETLWNCCQRDLVENGKLHGYLRMYWAKKILEWSADPEAALEYCITLNDRYSIDGHDPNGYAGAAWSIGGVHDRAWPERAVYGKIRYMNEKGCRRKFSVDTYIESIQTP